MSAANRPDHSSDIPESEREIVLTRLLSAPRERVFDAWTDCAHVANWYGPDGCTITTHEMDVRPGGVWRFVMHAPDGTDYDNWIKYREAVRPERLAYLHGSRADDPDAFEGSVTFTAQGEKTLVTTRALFKTRKQREEANGYGAVEIGQQGLRRLSEYLERAAGDR